MRRGRERRRLNGREVRMPPDSALGIDHYSYNVSDP